MKVRKIVNKSGIARLGLLNPFLLAFIPAIIIILSEPYQFVKYHFEQYSIPNTVLNWYVDLNGDGKKEEFRFGENIDKSLYLINYDHENTLLDQTNFNGSFSNSNFQQVPYSFDLRMNGEKVLAFLSQRNDSVFLNAYDPFARKAILNGRFITRIGGINGKGDYYFHCLGSMDANEDEWQELYFSIAAGYALTPRRVFRYDFITDSLIQSINTGAGYLEGSIFHSGDTSLILVRGAAYGNISKDDPVSCHDSCCWLLGFDKDLNLAFEPHALGSFASAISEIVHYKGHLYFIYDSHTSKQNINRLVKMNFKGEILQEAGTETRIIGNLHKYTRRGKSRFYTVDAMERYTLELDLDNMAFKKQIFPGKNKEILLEADFDGDDVNEYLVQNVTNNKIKIYNASLKLCSKSFSTEKGIYKAYFHHNPQLNQGKLRLQSSQKMEYWSYHINPYYALKYPFWLMIYLFSTAFIATILFYQNVRIDRQLAVEKKITNLQLKNLRNQLDPHFTFNALNSVGNAIYKEDKKVAYDLFLRFTRMIRSSLMASDKVFRSLEDELQFTNDYLKFQKTRFKNRFSESFKIDESVDLQSVQVPKMLVQGFVENAVKHAFFQVDYKGKITVKVEQKEKQTCITIQDNGIGIQRSKLDKKTSGTQKGEKITVDQIKKINELYHSNISISIQDLSVLDKNLSGTRIEIHL